MNEEKTNVLIVGLGYLGCSLGLALKGKVPGKFLVKGFDLNEEAIQEALSSGAIDQSLKDVRDALGSSDLVILCTPVDAIKTFLRELRSHEPAKGMILLDVGSTKGSIVELMGKLPAHVSAIGGHPMTGRITSGFADPDHRVFERKTFILTPSSNSTSESLAWITALVENIGAVPLLLDANLHDTMAASVSHLPHVLSIPLIQLLIKQEDPRFWKVAAGSFKAPIERMIGNRSMWNSIISDNKMAIAQVLKEYSNELHDFAEVLKTNSESQIIDYLEMVLDEYQASSTPSTSEK